MALYKLFHYELLTAKRSLHECLYPIMVFGLIVTLFPLSVSTDPKTLSMIAPGVVWVGVLLACLLSMDRLFREDWESGFLDRMLLSSQSLSVLILIKLLAHWVVLGLPLILVAPLLGLFLHLTYQAELALVVSLLLGTPILMLIGAMGVALTLGLRNQGLLLMILVIPFFIPVLIFGSSAVGSANQQLSVTGQYGFLAGLLLLSLCFVPWTIAGILRIGVAN